MEFKVIFGYSLAVCLALHSEDLFAEHCSRGRKFYLHQCVLLTQNADRHPLLWWIKTKPERCKRLSAYRINLNFLTIVTLISTSGEFNCSSYSLKYMKRFGEGNVWLRHEQSYLFQNYAKIVRHSKGKRCNESEPKSRSGRVLLTGTIEKLH